MIGFVKKFDDKKIMSFKVTDNKLLKKYTQMWKKVKDLLNTKFDSEPVYDDNDENITTKIKIYGDKVNTNFHSKKIPKEKTASKCLLLIMLDSVVKVMKRYRSQTLLEEFTYEIKKTKIESFINDELDASSSDDETDNGSDNETESDFDNEFEKSDNNFDDESDG